MAKAKKIKKERPSKDIVLPEKDIRVEPGQLTFLPALKKVITKKPK